MDENVTDNAITEAAVAIPTKQFFVSMLTRDITLADAILDLLDNCLDGALRLANGGDVDYSRHFVKITLSKDSFQIEDNCGGIPRDVAKNYAFKMGREPDDKRDTDTETIGMYGVGMKRAIFKMGRSAKVNTRHLEDAFEVPITSDWLDDKGWEPLPILDMTGADRLNEPGTKVSVTTLYAGVSRHFMNDGFLNELRISIAEHFTLFLQRGLKVEVNGTEVEAVHVELLVSTDKDGPAPFVFQKTIDDVVVSIAVGLNTGRGLASDEDDGQDFERDRSVSTAGWTVFCNDRAVIVGDKSRLTGWGDGIPLYHYQFSILTGIVEFRSKHAEKLPVTTTKRALDTSSDVWLQALVKMKEGMRIWISYTNNWKNHPRSDQTKFWKGAIPMPLKGTVDVVAERATAKKADGHIEYNPQKKGVIPKPETLKPSSRRVVFSRPIEEIRLVSKALFDTPDEAPGVVGDKCFELALQNADASEEGGNE
ncbi:MULTISPECIES: ATP-binding protein [Alphaproteobacteria]|uniref:ATPase n=2 Tax=Alphaproteobacteria TaxID=28211 RepID=A0A512HDI2_9HYPH|nr:MULTISPECIES: ATP-binding protein [Alphaproteobacteria]GEO83514.1 ATPase [Ciceribacter naphthalenivorans]GLR24335.1 ATPase [Ciceribacter naphthalenivorans]GLT07191.1 ATPase [Sphingomonas psychrolutea]